MKDLIPELTAELEVVEAELAERLALSHGVDTPQATRHALILLDKQGRLVEDELVARWHELVCQVTQWALESDVTQQADQILKVITQETGQTVDAAPERPLGFDPLASLTPEDLASANVPSEAEITAAVIEGQRDADAFLAATKVKRS